MLAWILKGSLSSCFIAFWFIVKDRTSTKVHTAPVGRSSLGYLFGEEASVIFVVKSKKQILLAVSFSLDPGCGLKNLAVNLWQLLTSRIVIYVCPSLSKWQLPCLFSHVLNKFCRVQFSLVFNVSILNQFWVCISVVDLIYQVVAVACSILKWNMVKTNFHHINLRLSTIHWESIDSWYEVKDLVFWSIMDSSFMTN